MSVFKKIQQRQENHADKTPPDALKRGIKHECVKFTQRASEYKDAKTNEYPMTLVAFFHKPDEVGTWYTTMPTIYHNMSEDDVKELNDLIKANKPPSIVYYGKKGKRNDVGLLEFGEDIDDKKLQMYLKLEEEDSSPTKSEPPIKKPRTTSTSFEDGN